MTRLTERMLDSTQYNRRKATEDTKRKIVGWEIWSCEEPEYRHSYDRTVSLFVHEGAAIITFDSGETVDLEAGDFLTIMSGAAATWSITKAIRNSFSYHDSFTSAENRSEQVYGVGNELGR